MATCTKARLLGREIVKQPNTRMVGDVEMTDVALHAAVFGKTRRSISDSCVDSSLMHVIDEPTRDHVKGHT